LSPTPSELGSTHQDQLEITTTNDLADNRDEPETTTATELVDNPLRQDEVLEGNEQADTTQITSSKKGKGKHPAKKATRYSKRNAHRSELEIECAA